LISSIANSFIESSGLAVMTSRVMICLASIGHGSFL
jgi:hypothetical protein